MLIKVDSSSPQSLSKQIAAQIRSGVAVGDVAMGERLPPARELAASLGVNMHTVVRAYALLRDDGLLEMRPGRGTRITADASRSGVAIADLSRQLIDEAEAAGMSRAALVQMIERM